MIRVWRHRIRKGTTAHKPGVKGDQYLYTTVGNHPFACENEQKVPLEGRTWSFDTRKDAFAFLRGIAEGTTKHTVELTGGIFTPGG